MAKKNQAISVRMSENIFETAKKNQFISVRMSEIKHCYGECWYISETNDWNVSVTKMS